jgi:pyoverdine/dityrosine biosynthesis protein Dit1
MSKEEIKYEINKVLDSLPDKALQELLRFLKDIEQRSSSSIYNPEALAKILSEDKVLLEKLAR